MGKVRRPRRNKAKTPERLDAHFRRRWAQRVGWPVVEPAVVVRAIRDGLAAHVWTESGTRSHWDYDHDGQLVRVVYDKPRKTVVTVLPVQREED